MLCKPCPQAQAAVAATHPYREDLVNSPIAALPAHGHHDPWGGLYAGALSRAQAGAAVSDSDDDGEDESFQQLRNERVLGSTYTTPPTSPQHADASVLDDPTGLILLADAPTQPQPAARAEGLDAERVILPNAAEKPGELPCIACSQKC